MKQYQIIKAVYADSLRQAIEKERDGIIMSAAYVDSFEKDDYDNFISRVQAIKRIDHGQRRKS